MFPFIFSFSSFFSFPFFSLRSLYKSLFLFYFNIGHSSICSIESTRMSFTPLHMRLSSPKSFKFQRHNSSIRPTIGFNIFLTASARSSIIFRGRRVSIARDMKTVGACIGTTTCRMLCFVTRRLQFFGALSIRAERDQRCHSPLQ